MMSPVFSPICQSISSLAILCNLYLLYVYFRCPLNAIKSYKYVFLLTAIQDLIYSACLLLAVPVAISENYWIVFVATGPLYREPWGQVLIVLFIVSFVTSLMLIANSFLYRYLQVCKHHLFQHIMAPQYISIIILINLAVFLNWMAAVYILYWPTEALVQNTSQLVQETTGLNAFDCAQLGFSLRYDFNTLDLVVMTETLAFMGVTAAAIFCSALKIHKTLKEGTFSKNLRKLHTQMFTLLVLQSLCPFTFLHGPAFIVYIYLFTGLSTPYGVVYVITILLSIFPLVTPIIIVAFLKDYRNHTLSTLRLSRRGTETTSIFISEMRTAI